MTYRSELMKASKLAILTAAALLTTAPGCKEAHVHEAFFPNLHESRTAQTLYAQSARGARIDATLYAIHFDGPALNSLGQSKLDLMMEDAAGTGTLAVYVSAPHDQSDPRRAAVEQYLTAAGLATTAFTTHAGVNPHATHLASDSLVRMNKTENPTGAHTNEATVTMDVASIPSSSATAR